MKVNMRVTHVQSGIKWVGEESELTQEELDEAIDICKSNLKAVTSMQLGNAILPGDFIRNHCVIRFLVDGLE